MQETLTAKLLRNTGFKPITILPTRFSHFMIIYNSIKTFQGKPYILLASQNKLSTSWIIKFTKIANNFGFKVVSLPSEGVVDQGTNASISLPLDPLEWLKIISCSCGYIGGRFHPIVISLASGNPVVSIDKYHKWPWQCIRSKTWLLLRQFRLNYCCFGAWSHKLLSPYYVFFLFYIQNFMFVRKHKLALARNLHFAS